MGARLPWRGYLSAGTPVFPEEKQCAPCQWQAWSQGIITRSVLIDFSPKGNKLGEKWRCF